MIVRTVELVALVAVVLYAKRRGALTTSRRDVPEALVLIALWAVFAWLHGGR